MKTVFKVLIVFVILALICAGGLFICKYYGKCNFLSIKKTNNLVAKSNYGEIYNSDVDDYINNLEKIFSRKIDTNKMTKDEKNLVVNEIVNQRKILSDARKSGVENTEEFNSRLSALKDDLAREFYLKDLISKNITDDSVKAKYFELKESLKDKKEYRVKHILVKTEADINKVVKELKTSKFEDVAKKYSIDTTAKNGGDLGNVIEGQTVKEFEDECKKAEINKVSKPFKTEFGWHVLLKESQKDVVVPEFDAVKDSLKNSLINDFMKNLSETNIKSANIIFMDK